MWFGQRDEGRVSFSSSHFSEASYMAPPRASQSSMTTWGPPVQGLGRLFSRPFSSSPTGTVGGRIRSLINIKALNK